MAGGDYRSQVRRFRVASDLKRDDDFQALEFLQVEHPKLEMKRKFALVLGANRKPEGVSRRRVKY
jgi:hypothetical protein